MKNKNLSDWAVALSVIACSAILFGALAMALSGTMLGKPDRTILVNFSDVTGVALGAQVKYGGAAAGRISGIRILTPEERLSSGDPNNTVQVTLAITKSTPALPADIKVTVAADTLLSDKFLLLSGGTPGGKELTDGSVLQGVAPVTIDQLSRNLDETLHGLRTALGGTKDGAGDVFAKVGSVLDNANSLVADAKTFLGETRPVVQDAQALITQTKGVVTDADGVVDEASVFIKDAGSLVSDIREPTKRTFAQLDRASATLEQFATRGNNLFANNEQKISTILSDLKVTGQNLKVTSTYAEILTRTLAQKPSTILWGGKPNQVPSREQILKAAGGSSGR